MIGFLATIGGLLAILLGIAAQSLSSVLVVVALGLFLALGLDPVVQRLCGLGMRRGWATLITAAAFAGVVAGIVALVVPTVVDQVGRFVRALPAEFEDFRDSAVYDWATETFGTSISDITAQAQDFLGDPQRLAEIGGGILDVGATIVSGVSNTLIAVVLTLYFLATLPTVKRAFVGMMPARDRPRVAELTEDVAGSVGGFLSGMVVLAAANAVASFLLLLALGSPFAALLAALAFFVTLIPLVGTVLFWVVGSLAALTISPFAGIAFAVVYLVYMQVEAYLLTPRVMNKTVAVPGVLVIIGALVGGTLLGLLGALVAVPVTAALLIIYRKVLKPIQDAKV